jgi:ferredoxin
MSVGIFISYRRDDASLVEKLHASLLEQEPYHFLLDPICVGLDCVAPSCGKCVQVCPTGALFEKGKSVAEMAKRGEFLPYLTLMRHQTK